jgi:predicted PurR-regulated permease PerM
MATTLLKVMRRHRRAILIVAILAFILLVIFGFTLGPDKIWRPPGADRQTQER